MPVTLHWFLPTNGDSRSDLSLGNAVGVRDTRIGNARDDRAPEVAYMGQIARSAEQLGFDAALTPTSSWCEDAWVMTAALSQVTERLRFLVAFRPGLTSPTLAAQMAATFQRVSGDRLLLNVVTGGDDREQQRFGDHLTKDERYARCGEFLHIVRSLWTGEPVSFDGEHYTVREAQIIPAAVRPALYFGGSSSAAIEVAAAYTDVYLTWGEPPVGVAEKISRVRERAAELGRSSTVMKPCGQVPARYSSPRLASATASPIPDPAEHGYSYCTHPTTALLNSFATRDSDYSELWHGDSDGTSQ